MGLLDRLFKTLSGADEKRSESSSEPPPDPASFLVPRDRPSAIPAPPPRARVEEPHPVSSPTDRTIVVTLGDVLGRIPPEFLREETHDVRRELRFQPGEFFADIPRGRVTVALSGIAVQVPDVFRVPITDDEDREVRLPLQKVLDQLIEPRASSPSPVLPAPAPAPPSLPEPAPLPAEPTITLSLAAIIAACPDPVFPGGKPIVAETMRVVLPLGPIESQLASGRVEISAGRLIALLPPDFAGALHLPDGEKIPLPLEEIFRNLPRSPVPAAPPAPTPVAPPEPAPPTTPELVVASIPPAFGPRPIAAPPLRSFEFQASSDLPAGSASTPAILHGADAPPESAPAPAAAPVHFSPPPLFVRPHIVLPPPISVAPEPQPETTSDQTAVLEFLAGGDGAK